MKYQVDLFAHGSKYTTAKTFSSFSLNERIAAGISAGANTQGKVTPNEDGLSIVTFDDTIKLYMVADAHFGCEASKIALQRFPELLSSATLLEEALVPAAQELNTIICDERDDESETTFLAVLQQQDKTHFLSVGDSLLYRYSDGKSRHVKARYSLNCYLGERSILPKSAYCQGLLDPFADGFALLTDGFESSHLEEKALDDVFRHSSLQQGIDRIMKRLIDEGENPGNKPDNGAIVVVKR